MAPTAGRREVNPGDTAAVAAAATGNTNTSTTSTTSTTNTATSYTYAPEQHQHLHHAASSDHELKLYRAKMGQCPDCCLQTHEQDPQGKFSIPLTDEVVMRGRCLLCHPLPSTMWAKAAGSGPSSVAALGGPSAPTHATTLALADRESHITPSPPPGEDAASRAMLAMVRPREYLPATIRLPPASAYAASTPLLALPAPAEEGTASEVAPAAASAASVPTGEVAASGFQPKKPAATAPEGEPPSKRSKGNDAMHSEGGEASVQPPPPASAADSASLAALPALGERSAASAATASIANEPAPAAAEAASEAQSKPADCPQKMAASAASETLMQTKRIRGHNADEGVVWGIYVGELNANGLRHGKGKMTWDDGETHDGQWKNDKAEGQGTWHCANNGEKYVGDWKNDKMNGQGTYEFASGEKYVGDWKNDKMNGQGAYEFANGNKYVGGWKNDKQKGHGTCQYANGDKYVGCWKNDKKEGQGTCQYANGDKYVGGCKNGKKHGQGTYEFADGDKYVGDFKNDKENGKGTFYHMDGKVDICQYKNGKPVGEGVIWSKDRHNAWLLHNGEKKGKISLERAKEIASRMGFDGVPTADEE